MGRSRIKSRTFIRSGEGNFGHCCGQVAAVFFHFPNGSFKLQSVSFYSTTVHRVSVCV